MSSPTRLHRGWLEASASAGMFAFGLVMAVLGATLPSLSRDLRFDLAQSGDLFLAMNTVMLAATLVTGLALDRFGIKPALIGGPAFTSAGVAIIAGALDFHQLIGGVVLLGLGGAILNSATNTLVADLYEDPRQKNGRLNLLGVYFGVGALFVPLAMGALLATLGLRTILLAAAALALLPAIPSLVLLFPGPKQSGGAGFGGFARLARDPLVLAFAFLLLFETGNEFVLSSYITSFLTRELGFSVPSASYVLAAYWGSVLAQRVALSRLALHVPGQRIVMAGAAGTAIAVALMASAQSGALVVAGVLLLGFSISCVFPTTLGLAGARFASRSGTVFGFLIAVALVGGMTEPWLVAQIGASAGLRRGLLLPIGGALAILALQIWISARIKENGADGL